MCDDAAADGHEVRQAVDAVIAEKGKAFRSSPAGPVREGPDPETWGLLPEQVARAAAAEAFTGDFE